MMVYFSTIAVSQQFSGTELLFSVLKLVFFLTMVCRQDLFYSYITKKNKKFIDWQNAELFH
jgi:CPA2 family monovalent cation:H+ antiporter-2